MRTDLTSIHRIFVSFLLCSEATTLWALWVENSKNLPIFNNSQRGKGLSDFHDRPLTNAVKQAVQASAKSQADC